MIYAATADNAHSFAAPRQGSGGFGGQHDPMAAVMATPSLHGEFVEADGSGGNDQVVVRAIRNGQRATVTTIGNPLLGGPPPHRN